MASYIAANKLVELLQAANITGQMNVRVLEADQLAVGADPRAPSCIIDFSREVVRPVGRDGAQHDETRSSPRALDAAPAGASRRLTRKSGTYVFELKGETKGCTTLKDLLAEGLRGFEQHQPGTLDKLSRISPRNKRIVARDPHRLFDQRHLSEKYSEKLVDGWWYGTNNSTAETLSWLKRGCELCGLAWGKDFLTSLEPAPAPVMPL